MEKRKYFNLDFFILALLVIAFNLPYFLDRAFYPSRDTKMGFETFYFFYNELLFHHQAARWVPYGNFGVDGTAFPLSMLRPPDFFVACIGAMMKVKNVLLLYKVVFVVEQWIYLAAMYLLSRLLFKKRSTVFIVCAAAIGSTVWLWQLNWNFYNHLLLPLVTYLLLLFFIKKRPEFFWLAGITALFWGIYIGYVIVLWVFLLSIFCGFLFLNDTSALRHLFTRSASNILLFAFFLVFCWVYVHFVCSSFSHLSFSAPVRDITTGKVSYDIFMTYGYVLASFPLLMSFIFGAPPYLPIGSEWNNTVYIGLIPLVFFCWAVIRVRKPFFLAFLFMTMALVWLSISGIFTSAAYHFPGMRYFRCVQHVYGFVRTFMLICAGFGLEDFWSTATSRKFRYLASIAAALLFLFDLLAASRPHWVEHWLFIQQELLPGFAHVTFGSVLFRVMVNAAAFSICVAAYLLRKKIPSLVNDGKFIKVVCISAILLDMASFQYVVFQDAPRLSVDERHLLESTRAHELKYQDQRLSGPAARRQKEALELASRNDGKGFTQYSYDFIQLDPCAVDKNTASELYCKGVPDLLKLTGDDPDSRYKIILGCESPKMRLVPNAVFLNNTIDIKSVLPALRNLNEVVILRDSKERTEGSPMADKEILDLREGPAVTRFSSNEVVVEASVHSDLGSWLVYSDAYHPYWRAAVNGKRARVYEAYLAFKAVRLPPGRNKVRFYFGTPFTNTVSAWFNFFGGFLLILLFLSLFWRRDDYFHLDEQRFI